MADVSPPNWPPPDWPPECPPSDALPAKGEVFRAVKRNPLDRRDFRTHAERDAAPNAPPCLRCGLSVYRTLDDVLHHIALLPSLGKVVARADLAPDHGLTKPTPGSQPTHTTWWPIPEIDRPEIFTVVQVVP